MLEGDLLVNFSYSWEPEYREVLKSYRDKININYFDHDVAESLLDHSLYRFLEISIFFYNNHSPSK